MIDYACALAGVLFGAATPVFVGGSYDASFAAGGFTAILCLALINRIF